MVSQRILDFADSWGRRLWPVYLVLISAVWAALVWRPAWIQNGHISSDWLIDYRFGLVRRGLSGELLWPLQHATGLAVEYWVAIVQLACFVVLVAGLWWLTRRVRPPLAFWLLALSPATLAFSFFSEVEAGRKEVLLFALYAVFAVWLVRLRQGAQQAASQSAPFWMLPVWGLTVVAAVLMHELLAFYVPWMVALLWCTGAMPRAQRWALSVALLGSAAGALALLAVWGGPLDGARFCRAFVSDGMSASICRGILVFPITSVAESVTNTRLLASQFGYAQVYAPGLLLALLPVAWMAWEEGWRVTRRWLLWLLACLVATLPLFVLAVDWGRFIQIHLVLGLLTWAACLTLGAKAEAAPSRPVRRASVLAAAAVCLVLWDLPVCCETGVGSGVVGQVARIVR